MKREGTKRRWLLFISIGGYFFLNSLTFSDVVSNYGTIFLPYDSPGFAAVDTFNIVVGDVERTYADVNKAKAELGYNPKTDITIGLKKFVEWLRETVT